MVFLCTVGVHIFQRGLFWRADVAGRINNSLVFPSTTDKHHFVVDIPKNRGVKSCDRGI